MAQKKAFVTRYFTKSELNEILNKINLKLDEGSTVGLFKSRYSCLLREIFIRNTIVLLPLFPLFYWLCRMADKFHIGGRVPPQILIIKAIKNLKVQIFQLLKLFLLN